MPSPTRPATWRRSRCSSGTSAPGGSASASCAASASSAAPSGATLSHDAHNIVVVGVDDGAMARAVGRLRELGGGIVVVEEQGVRAELPLPVAGLLSDRPLAEVLDASRDDQRRRRRARRHLPGPVSDARVPGAVRDPGAQDHRPRARRRRPLRAGSAGRLTFVGRGGASRRSSLNACSTRPPRHAVERGHQRGDRLQVARRRERPGGGRLTPSRHSEGAPSGVPSSTQQEDQGARHRAVHRHRRCHRTRGRTR